jgi:hypothetical protein
VAGLVITVVSCSLQGAAEGSIAREERAQGLEREGEMIASVKSNDLTEREERKEREKGIVVV